MSISVIIPTYNSVNYIENALNSVFSQDEPVEEVIVIDDGSSDDTLKILRKYPVKIITQSNQGPAAARNTGILSAKGDWIAFLDSDDTWIQGKVKKIKETINQFPNVSILASDEFEGTLNGPMTYKALHRYFDKEKNLFSQLYRGCFLSTSTMIIKRKLLLEVNGMDINLPSAQDYDLWLRLARIGTLHFIPYPLSNYIVRSGSVSSNVDLRLLCLLRIADKYMMDVSFKDYIRRILLCFYEAECLFVKQKKIYKFWMTLFSIPGRLIKSTFYYVNKKKC
jgi:glycosyltransferase involved in cell wall biosynthesis